MRVNLVRRSICGDPFCPFCAYHLETTEHLFFQCEWFAAIWESEPFYLTPPPEQWGFANWFQWLRAQLDDEGSFLAGVVCWRVWWVRNQLVHGATEGVGGDIVEWAKLFLDSYKTALVPKLPKAPRLLEQWMPPPAGMVKINCNVGFLHPEHYQVAMVARSENGRCLGWRVG